MKKKTDRDVGTAETSAVPVVSTRAVPSSAGSAIEPMGVDAIRSRILTVRGVQVMLDRDLAELYGVPTKRLNEQVKRNVRRFPESFMFQLTKEELEDWRSQIATPNNGGAAKGTQIVTLNREDWRSQIATSNLEQYAKMGVRNRPYAFTEHGIIMLASVLKEEALSCVFQRNPKRRFGNSFRFGKSGLPNW